MIQLGISAFYHDAAACLVKDGKVLLAAEEERFTEIKHDASFPINAIKWLLEESRIKIQDMGICKIVIFFIDTSVSPPGAWPQTSYSVRALSLHFFVIKLVFLCFPRI